MFLLSPDWAGVERARFLFGGDPRRPAPGIHQPREDFEVSDECDGQIPDRQTHNNDVFYRLLHKRKIGDSLDKCKPCQRTLPSL
jgi:hypothetical protein